MAQPDPTPCAHDERRVEWNETLPYTDPRNDEIVMNRSSDPDPLRAEPAHHGGTWSDLGIQ